MVRYRTYVGPNRFIADISESQMISSSHVRAIRPTSTGHTRPKIGIGGAGYQRSAAGHWLRGLGLPSESNRGLGSQLRPSVSLRPIGTAMCDCLSMTVTSRNDETHKTIPICCVPSQIPSFLCSYQATKDSPRCRVLPTPGPTASSTSVWRCIQK